MGYFSGLDKSDSSASGPFSQLGSQRSNLRVSIQAVALDDSGPLTTSATPTALSQPTVMPRGKQLTRKYTMSGNGMLAEGAGSGSGIQVVVENKTLSLSPSSRFTSPVGDMAFPGNRVHAVAAPLPLVDADLNFTEGLSNRRKSSPSPFANDTTGVRGTLQWCCTAMCFVVEVSESSVLCMYRPWTSGLPSPLFQLGLRTPPAELRRPNDRTFS